MNFIWLKNLKIDQKLLVLNGICVGFILIYNDRALPLKWLGANNTILKDNETILLTLLTGQSTDKSGNLNKITVNAEKHNSQVSAFKI